jgi:hypothetical protein
MVTRKRERRRKKREYEEDFPPFLFSASPHFSCKHGRLDV